MKKASKKWTQDEIEILKKYYWDLGPLGLTKMIPNHPHCSIVAKGRKLGLNSKDKVFWTDEEVEIMKQYYTTEGTKVYKRLQNRSKRNKIYIILFYNYILEYFSGDNFSEKLYNASYLW